MKLLIVDIETTGLSNTKNRIIEIAYLGLDVTADGLVATGYQGEQRWRPHAKTEFHPKAYSANGYYDGHPDWAEASLVDSQEEGEWWGRFIRESQGYYLAGHNIIKFDAPFMANTSLRHGFKPLWDFHMLDTMTAAGLIAAYRGLPNWKLETIYKALGGPPVKAHRAMPDVLMTKFVIEDMFARWGAFERAMGVKTAEKAAEPPVEAPDAPAGVPAAPAEVPDAPAGVHAVKTDETLV